LDRSLPQVYERLDELGADVAEAKASHLLHGLGFTKAMMQKKCKEFSGAVISFQRLPGITVV
jgi:ATP-binding cassette subfamily F protein 2